MLPRLKLQTFWFALLLVSILWTAGVFGTLLYSVISPTKDLSAIVRALQGRGLPPQTAVSLVQQALDQGGRLDHAIHVGHYVGASVVHQNGASHTTSEVSDTYVAWFRKIPHPLVLVVKRYNADGQTQQYEIGSADSVMSVARDCALPLLALTVSIFLVIKRKSPVLSEPHGQGPQTDDK